MESSFKDRFPIKRQACKQKKMNYKRFQNTILSCRSNNVTEMLLKFSQMQKEFFWN